MSLKRTKTPPPTKRPTTKKKAQAVPALKDTPGLLQEQLVPPPIPYNVLVLPAPALLGERREADALIQKLTDTLPPRLADEAQMGQASEHLIITRKLRKAFEAKIKEDSLPIKAALEKVKNEYSGYVIRLESTEGVLNRLLNDYRVEATRKQVVEDARIAREHQKTMDEARAQGVNPLSLPVPQAAPAPPSGFHTAHGKTTTMRVPRWKCTDPTQVPYEHAGVKLWILNDAGIGALRRGAGVEAVSPIPGIAYYYDETTVVK